MRILPIAFVTSLVAASFGVACGSSSNNSSPGDDGGGAADSGGGETSLPTDSGGVKEAAPETGPAPYPAFVPTDIPQVATAGGPVMSAPKVIPVFFSTDDATSTASLTDFVAKVGATDYWKAAVGEYGVGALTTGTPVMLTAADDPGATIDDTTIETWLAAKLNGNDASFGTPDANTLYALFYPTGTSVTLSGGQSCVSGGFGGYHNNITLDATHAAMDVAYAVLPRCASDPALPNANPVNITTASASHEFAEAATDPFPSTNPAFLSVDSAHRYWTRLLGGGEVGDMCAQNPQSFTTFPELAYAVQRIWSNKAAMTGADPCLPVPQGSVYFNTFPEANDAVVSVGRDGGVQPGSLKGVNIAVGQSKEVDLDLFSMAPTSGPWTVTAYDGNELQTGQSTSAQLKFAFDKTSGQNGDKIKMTITVVTAGSRKQESYLLVSKLGGAYGLWAGVVGTTN